MVKGLVLYPHPECSVKLRDLKSSTVSDPVFIEYNVKLRSRIGRTVLIGLKRKGSIKSNAIPDPDLTH